MEFQHVNAKFFVDGDLHVEPARFIDVFHQWIRDGVMDELLIDVADYRHVPDGPGVLLIGHEADYSLDQRGGRNGLRYNRKTAVPGDNRARLSQAFGSAAKACRMLEEIFAIKGPTRFDRCSFEISINDRALAPNTDATFEACRPDFEAFLGEAFGQFTLERSFPEEPRRCLGASITVAEPADFAALERALRNVQRFAT